MKGIIRRKDVAFHRKDWRGRDVYLLKSTIKNHIARFHYDEVLLVDRIKDNLASPTVVVENPGARSEQALYEIPVGGHPYLQVNIKYRGWPRKNLIVSFYGVDEIPKGRVLWKKQGN